MVSDRRNVRLYSTIKYRKSPLKGSRPSVPHGTNVLYFMLYPHDVTSRVHTKYFPDRFSRSILLYPTLSKWCCRPCPQPLAGREGACCPVASKALRGSGSTATWGPSLSLPSTSPSLPFPLSLLFPNNLPLPRSGPQIQLG